MSARLELERTIVYIAEKLVDTPSALVLFVDETESKFLFVLSSKNPGEIGQLIGERGATANALRTLLRGMARNLKCKDVSLMVTAEIDSRF